MQRQYNWQCPDWPHFYYDDREVQTTLYRYAQEASVMQRNVTYFLEDDPQETLIDLMVQEAVNTAKIEGEVFDDEEVRSSIRNHIGLPKTPAPVKDPRANAMGELMVKTRETFSAPLTKETLFEWHHCIIADPLQRERMTVGAWRQGKEPMQIVSGYVGRERVFFEAPPSERVPVEMERFIKWFNETAPTKTSTPLVGPIRAAIAHLYFESIHPFEDGNGRIGRAIAEKALSQDLGAPVMLSLSKTIYDNRKGYYQALHAASGYSLEITEWIHYFVETVYQAQLDSKELIDFILRKSRFWRRYETRLNPRQQRALSRMFAEGPEGFKGGMNAAKYMKITHCSKATATRDLAALLEYKALRQEGGGRSTRYFLNLD